MLSTGVFAGFRYSVDFGKTWKLVIMMMMMMLVMMMMMMMMLLFTRLLSLLVLRIRRSDKAIAQWRRGRLQIVVVVVICVHFNPKCPA